MNLAKLKSFAPAARTAFIAAVTRRAGILGILPDRTEPVTESGDVALIGGQPFPRSVVPLRRQLLDIIQRDGFGPTMEAMAYTWFNRLVALRFMELHDGWLDHGYRVLSHPQGTALPEILQHAEHVSLKGLDREEVIRLKLDGNRDEELYRLLLLAQCAELNHILPDVFSKLDDATILLLPDNLLHSDSLIRQLVAGSDAEDWQQVEVLGWLYQFYISERKDQVMSRKSAVPTEDIPAVTQLFTPHWIVRYLVENSLGRLWLLNRPGSRLREHMPYYIEEVPSDQSSVISGEENAPRSSKAPSDLFSSSASSTDHCSLSTDHSFLRITKPEEIRLCDPAVGSGHMLTYAFDLLTLIYEEEGYAPTEIPALILRHNLHGLEICPRAAQLAELALVFKAREKSRRFFQPEHLVRPRIIELRDVRFAENELRDYIHALGLGDLFHQPMLRLLHQFEEAKNFGSLIQPCLDERAIADARRAIEAKDLGGQLFLRETHLKVLRVLEQAEALTQRYHVVVANPPYMGQKQMNAKLKDFADSGFPQASGDLFAVFIQRGFGLVIENGYSAMVTMQSWMFLSSFQEMRLDMLERRTIVSLVHMGSMVMGIAFGTVATVWRKAAKPETRASYSYIGSTDLTEEGEPKEFPIKNERCVTASAIDFKQIPGSPIAYWAPPSIRRSFGANKKIGDIGHSKNGMTTGENDRFVRSWHEVPRSRIDLGRKADDGGGELERPWVPYSKGGQFRKWYGNAELVLYWGRDGERLKQNKPKTILRNPQYYFREAITWTLLSMLGFGARLRQPGFAFDVNGMSLFLNSDKQLYVLAFLNSHPAEQLLKIVNPTIAFQAGDIASLPLSFAALGADEIAEECVTLARADWDNFETSWDFRDQPLLRPGLKGAALEASWRNWEAQSTAAIRRMQELETENNRLFIAAYGLDGELQPDVPEEQITLARPDQEKDMKAFLSYALGCMMGRYSLDHPGLILANTGDTLAHYLAKVGKTADQLSFVPDEDGIIPVLDGEWFEDDIVARTRDFLRATFGPDTLNENLRFFEDALGKDLRKYFLTDFYKDHLQTYKKRPIYWMVQSPKRGFSVLIYLQRYTKDTLNGVLNRYLRDYQVKLRNHLAHLDQVQASAGTAKAKTDARKESEKLNKILRECEDWERQVLLPLAQQRIELDLDDGVKTNYLKLAEALAPIPGLAAKEDE